MTGKAKHRAAQPCWSNVYIYIITVTYIYIYIYLLYILYMFVSIGMYVYSILRKPASWLVAVCERSENRGCGGVVAERERNLAVPLC